jgi:hypothetical protein
MTQFLSWWDDENMYLTKNTNKQKQLTKQQVVWLAWNKLSVFFSKAISSKVVNSGQKTMDDYSIFLL